MHKNCLVCNSENLAELKGYEKDYLFKCRSCGFVFCNKIPSHEELINHYNGYSRKKKISPITIKRYNELLDHFESYRKTNNIIDVGCGGGYFLEIAKQRGWNVYGTEFTDRAIEVCSKKGILMQNGILDSSHYKNIEFDVVTSFEVIEHVNNPQDEIKSIKEILRLDGLFYFTTPNFNSISRFFLKGRWSIIEYPEHLSYYTPATINILLKMNNFNKIKIETTGVSINRLLKNQQTNITSKNVNRDEIIREKSETKLLMKFFKNFINGILNVFGIGDTIKGYYKKM